MTAVATIVIVIIAVAFAAFLIYALRGVGKGAERSLTADAPVARRPMPIVTEFHVRDDTAYAVFAVPLGDVEPGQHLIDLLCATAVEYVREKTIQGLPLEDVHRIEVSAMRGQNPEVLCTVDLPDAGVLPEADESLFVGSTHDPIAAVHKVIADSSVASQSGSGMALEPISETIELSGPTDARLRSIGVDPATMGLNDLVLGLLRVSGYDVHVGRTGMSGLTGVRGETADVYGLTGDGKSTTLVIIEHAEGSHPELDESVLAKFGFEMAQVNPERAMLVTDKYSPYSMYEREKRDTRSVYITRERLQSFVDSFGLS